ncbi:MAG: MATE family efflux transporter, partial [Pseudobdellovibrio sp.]
GFVMIIMLVFANPIIGIFTQEASIFQYGVEGLRIIATGFVFFGFGMVLTQALNGAGDTKTPTRFNIICFWLFQTPLAYALVTFTDMKAAGALIAIPAAHVLLTVISWRYFKAGKWKDVQV